MITMRNDLKGSGAIFLIILKFQEGTSTPLKSSLFSQEYHILEPPHLGRKCLTNNY